MENLEEVLQALDEFQKMRPTQIPRELEEYLCWVAKTGDPVYQWSLIKTLFREKLTRVMTDFYENCPTLELAPCPNVEHFNYDTMKTSLLERLESFANAPFTVQRICELLTAPRKEYNRVDKFMRAIEKNILVVSTREPGPIARRSENGDGMVNGSVDDEASVIQPPQDVEMEYWEKDCASTVTISVHTVESETPMLHTVIPAGTVVKNVFGTESVPQEKLESTSSKSEAAATSCISATPDITGVPNVSSQTQTQDSPISQSMLSTPSPITTESTSIVSDVTEAIINEDTSSQPGLDLEHEESDSIESTKKLQTTFQAKDFTAADAKSSTFYEEDRKPSVDGISDSSEEAPITTEKPNDKLSSKPESSDKSDPENPITEDFLPISDDNVEKKVKTDSVQPEAQLTTEPTETAPEKVVQQLPKDTDGEIPELETGDIKVSRLDEEGIQSAPSLESTDAVPNDTELKDQTTNVGTTEETKPIIEEPPTQEQDSNAEEKETENQGGLTITEALDGDTTESKSIVPDPIPIIEEPKEREPQNDIVSDTTVVDVPETTSNLNTDIISSPESKQDELAVTCENTETTEQQIDGDSRTVKRKRTNSLTPESNGCKSRKDQMELMEVDEEETLSIFQPSEPMEQDTVELSKS